MRGLVCIGQGDPAICHPRALRLTRDASGSRFSLSLGDGRREITTMTTTSDLVPSLGLDAFFQKRTDAESRLREAQRLIKEAGSLIESAVKTNVNFFYEVGACKRGIDDDTWADLIMDKVDKRLWSAVVEETGLLSFMDAKARADFQKTIDDGKASPLTAQNLAATVESMHGSRGEMFERGVIEVFRCLSWDYKTNRAACFGKRLIVKYLTKSFSGKATDYVDDLERALCILDGKPIHDHRTAFGSAVRAVEYRNPVCTIERDFFSARLYANGNGHHRISRNGHLRTRKGY